MIAVNPALTLISDRLVLTIHILNKIHYVTNTGTLVRRVLRLFAPLTQPQVFQTGRLSFPPRVSSLCRILYSPFSFDPLFGRFVSSIFICPSVPILGYLRLVFTPGNSYLVSEPVRPLGLSLCNPWCGIFWLGSIVRMSTKYRVCLFHAW